MAKIFIGRIAYAEGRILSVDEDAHEPFWTPAYNTISVTITHFYYRHLEGAIDKSWLSGYGCAPKKTLEISCKLHLAGRLWVFPLTELQKKLQMLYAGF